MGRTVQSTMMTSGSVPEFLSDPASYPDRPSSVELIQTEGSWIALAGGYAYKVRRPIKFDAWDFSTLALREKACLREVRLNRRLGGDIYLDVVPLFVCEGRFSFHRAGEPAEFAVRMRRLPAETMMDRVVADRDPLENEIASLADLLAEFYSSAQSASKASKAGAVSVIESSVRQNLKIVGEYLGGEAPLPLIECAQLLYLARAAETFERRAAVGKVRDGHGSLRCDHICLADPPIIIGCVEFRDRERNMDILCDVASLLVDLDVRGRGDAGQRLWTMLSERIEDEACEPHLDFYRSYRAMCSARLDAVRPTQTDEVRRDCRRMVELAAAYARRYYRPKLFATVGLVGTGKSTLAHALTGEFGLECISTEEIRAELFPEENGRPRANRLDLGQAERIYESLLDRARAKLASGVSVVLDAGFFRRAFREKALQIARDTGAAPLFLDCRLSKSDAIARLDQRFRKHRAKRMPTPDLYEEQAILFEPTDELPEDSVCILNMSQPVPALVQTVRDAI